ncbi:hypothetical protein TSAR_013763 [Trichomalopsis sarcophagae]|uniref:Uncharacterized protein n=1 Tax=Trichomalopsis sarcophagae TaxID=543379 RepID=A0A232FMW7_9HYME|nr:hypothetical protein TSAR_013763 [Trichomalopsis sarcophagae]
MARYFNDLKSLQNWMKYKPHPIMRDYFVILDVRREVKQLIENNAEYYSKVVAEQIITENGLMKDVYDGLYYQNFRASLSDDDKNNYASSATSEPISCAINNEKRYIKLFALCCCFDSVARGNMQGIVQFNGYFGCCWCLQRGEYMNVGKGHAMKYPVPNEDEQIDLRTEEMTFNHLRKALQTDDIIFGVTAATPLMNLKHFNIVDGFVPDSMHCVALGIVKQFAEMWFKPSKEDYYINSNTFPVT